MPRIYVANPTRQARKFFYRLDMGDGENVVMNKTPAKFIVIPPGRQMGMDFVALSQVETIVKQLSKIGAKAVTEKNRPGNRPVPYVFSTDKPVPGVVIEAIHDFNKKNLSERATKRRQAMAVVASEQAQAAMDATLSNFQVDGHAELATFEASVEMVDDGGAKVEGKAVAEGLRLEPKQEAQRAPVRRRAN